MASNISTLGQALDQISRLKSQQAKMDLLSAQLATGKKTQEFSGLGSDILASKKSRASINALDTYMSNIKHTDRRINLMNNAIGELQAQTNNIIDSLTVAVQEGDYPELQQIQDLAGNIYDYMLSLINAKDGDRYLFAGADSSAKPVTDTGLMDAFIGEYVPDETDLTNPPLVSSGVVGQWASGAITTEEFIASYHGVNETILGYSTSLTNDIAGKVTTRVNDQAELDYTVLADSPGFKDILMVMGVLKNMPPVDYAPGALNDPTATTLPEDSPPWPPAEKQENFFAVINDLAKTLTGAVDALESETFKLANVQARLSIIKENHTQEVNALKTIVSDVEDVDDVEVATKINQLQIQIETSFQVTAILSQLSLSRFI